MAAPVKGQLSLEVMKMWLFERVEPRRIDGFYSLKAHFKLMVVLELYLKFVKSFSILDTLRFNSFLEFGITLVLRPTVALSLPLSRAGETSEPTCIIITNKLFKYGIWRTVGLRISRSSLLPLLAKSQMHFNIRYPACHFLTVPS